MQNLTPFFSNPDSSYSSLTLIFPCLPLNLRRFYKDAGRFRFGGFRLNDDFDVLI